MKVAGNLNPSPFLCGNEMGDPEHNCLDFGNCQTKVREDLTHASFPYGDKSFVDGSSQCVDGKRFSGYAVIDRIKEKRGWPRAWSTQNCELHALKQVLHHLKGKEGTIYTDSRYAYRVVHTLG